MSLQIYYTSMVYYSIVGVSVHLGNSVQNATIDIALYGGIVEPGRGMWGRCRGG